MCRNRDIYKRSPHCHLQDKDGTNGRTCILLPRPANTSSNKRSVNPASRLQATIILYGGNFHTLGTRCSYSAPAIYVWFCGLCMDLPQLAFFRSTDHGTCSNWRLPHAGRLRNATHPCPLIPYPIYVPPNNSYEHRGFPFLLSLPSGSIYSFMEPCQVQTNMHTTQYSIPKHAFRHNA